VIFNDLLVANASKALQLVQLHENCIWIHHTHPSLALKLNVAIAPLVGLALVLVILHVGALVSITKLLAALYALVFHNLSYDLTLHRYLVPFVNAVGVHDVLVHVHCWLILENVQFVLN
jgi:hypothetical protein